MAMCMILGHHCTFERDFFHDLCNAVDQIVEQENEIEFMLVDSEENGYFDVLCMQVVLEVKEKNPTKDITITLLVDNPENRFYSDLSFRKKCREIDAASLPVSMRQWVLDRADYVISYLYFALQDVQNDLYYAARQKNLKIIDIANADTAAHIEMHRALAPDVLAAELTRRKSHQLRPAVAAHIPSCSITALGPATDDAVKSFEKAVIKIIKKLKITDFWVAQEYCHSEYMSILKQFDHIIDICAITHYPEMSQQQWHTTGKQYVPPCSAIENVIPSSNNPCEQAIETAKIMIEQSSICICDSSHFQYIDQLKEALAKTPVYDIDDNRIKVWQEV